MVMQKEKIKCSQENECIEGTGNDCPRVITKINRVRNLVEHEFVRPDQEQVEDFFDITLLFLLSTEKYIYYYPSGCQIENTESSAWLDFNYDRDKGSIEFIIHLRELKGEDISIKVSADEEASTI